MGMTKEEVVNILSQYRGVSFQSKSMKSKVQEMENNLYSAQAGFVENPTGTRVSGGKHAPRTERLSILTDLKDEYNEMYIQNETICRNTLTLILQLYTNNERIKVLLENNKVSTTLKLQIYENILIDYYINDKTISVIARNQGYSERNIKRLLNAARNEFYLLYKDNEYSYMEMYIKGKCKLNIIQISKQ